MAGSGPKGEYDIAKFTKDRIAMQRDLEVVPRFTKPVVLDSYAADSGYTYAGSPASHALRNTIEAAPFNRGVELVSASAATTTMSVEKATSAPIVPRNAGVIAALVKVNGKKSGRVLTLTNSVIWADNAATPLVRDGWMWIAAHASEFASFYALTSAQSVTPRFQCQLSGNDGVTTAAIRAFMTKAGGRPSVCLTFDDATDSQASIAFPIMDALGLVGTIFVPSAFIDTAGHLTLDQLKERRDKGWAICCDSTYNDTLTSTTPAAAVDDLEVVRNYLVANGLAENGSENHGCWTFGTWTEPVCAAFEASGMQTMRTTQGGLTSNLKYTIYDRFGLGDIAMTLPSWSSGFSGLGGNNVDTQTAIDLAVLRGSHITLHYHTFVESGATTLASNRATFQIAMDYLKALVDAGTLDVLSRTEWFSRVQRASPLSIGV